MARPIWLGFLAVIPAVLALVVIYQNVLPFGREQVFTIDVGARDDVSGTARLSAHPDRVSPRQSMEDVTFREITSDLVYLRLTASDVRRATEVSATVKFKPALPKNPSLDLGAKRAEGWNFSFGHLYDAFLGKLNQFPLVADDRYRVFATDTKSTQRFSSLDHFFSSLRPGQVVAAERPQDFQALLPSSSWLRPEQALDVEAPGAPPDPYWQTRPLLRQVSKLPPVLRGRYNVFATGAPPTRLPRTFEEFMAALMPGTTIASDSPGVVSPLAPSFVDKAPSSFYGDRKVLAPQQPKDPFEQSRPLLQRIAALPSVVKDQYAVFSVDPSSTLKAGSLQEFMAALKPGAVIASDDPKTLQPLLPLLPDKMPAVLRLDGDTSCKPDTRGPTRTDVTLRGAHTFWTWVRADSLSFSLTKRDLNGYAGADSLTIEAFNSSGQSVGSSSIPDDGDATASVKLGPIQKGSISLTSLTPGPYRITVKGAGTGEDFIIGPIDSDQDKLIVQGPVFLAGGAYTREPFKPLTLYLGLFDPAEPQVNLGHSDFPQRVLFGPSSSPTTLDVPPTQDRWIPLGQKLDSGMWQLTAEKGDLQVDTVGGAFFSFSPCSWFDPRPVSVLDLSQGLAGAKPPASYVVITQPGALEEPPPAKLQARTTPVSCTPNSRQVGRVDLGLTGNHTFWLWAEKGSYNLTVGKRNLNLGGSPNEVSIALYDPKGEQLLYSLLPDSPPPATTVEPPKLDSLTVRLGPLNQGAYRLEIGGKGSFLIDFLETDLTGLVAQGKVSVGNTSSPGEPLKPVTLYTYSYKPGSLSALAVGAAGLQPLLVSTSGEQRTLSLESEGKPVGADVPAEQMVAVTSLLGNVQLTTNGYFSFTPCSWFTPETVKLVPLVRDPNKVSDADFLVVTATNYNPPSIVIDVAGQWYESTVSWKGESVYIPPDAPVLDFVFSTSGGMYVDWVRIKLTVPPLWARFAKSDK